MNKNIVIIVTILISVTILGSLYLYSNSSKKEVSKDVIVDEISRGKYIEYKDPQTLQIHDSKVVLFFYANWCPTCIPVDREFKKDINKLPDDVIVIRINYNDSDTDSNEKDLAIKYGITYQHTFVQIEEGGGEVAKWNGGSIDQLVLNIK